LHAGGRATLEELKNHWRYFVAVTVFGCMLVVVSSYWWLGVHSRPATYVFQGEIMGIDKDDKLSSSELYIRAISYDDSDEKIISFVAVELQPFESNRVFIINMTRHSSKVAKKPMRIKYDDCPVHRYYLVGDDLVPIGNGSSQKDCKLSSLGRV
jgi:hypothetical protein